MSILNVFDISQPWYGISDIFRPCTNKLKFAPRRGNGLLRYDFFEDLSVTPPIDKVSSKAMSVVIAGIRADVINGVYAEFPVNTPTIMVDGDGRWCRSVGAYENICVWSNDFTQWPKASGGVGLPPVITSNFSNAPDGTQTASRFQCNLAGGITTLDTSKLNLTITFSDGDSTGGIWLKSNTGEDQKVGFNVAGDLKKTIATLWQFFPYSRTTATTSTIRLGLRGGYEMDDTCDISVWHCSFNAGKYILPYIETTGSSRLSVDESGSETNGLKYADISSNLSGLRDALDGVAEGEVIVNGDFSSFTNERPDDWVVSSNDEPTQDYVEENANGMRMVSTSGDNWWIFQNGLAIGNKYEISLILHSVESGGVRFIGAGGAEIFKATAPGETKIRMIADSLNLTFQVTDRADTDLVIKSISVKEISQSKGRMVIPLKFGFNAGDVSGILNILTADADPLTFLTLDATNNLLQFTDGTNTATAYLSTVSMEKVIVTLDWGLLNGTPKMRVSINGLYGVIVDFVGQIPMVADNFVRGWDSKELIYIGESLKINKAPSWI